MITKFIEPWVLFPGIMVLLLLFLGVVLVRTGSRARGLLAAAEAARIQRVTARVRTIGTVLIGIAILLYLISTPTVSRILLGSLERRVPAPATIPSDVEAVVVLGGGVVADAPSEEFLTVISGAPGASRRPAALSTEAESRLIYGMRLARRLGVPIVVTGGRVLAAESVPAEADVARELLLDLGFPDEQILVERRSRTTAENARNTAEMFGFSRVAVVTSAYHMPRSLFAFESVGMSAVPEIAPAGIPRLQRPRRILLGSLERRVPAPATIPSVVEAVVVLGGGVVADAPSEEFLTVISGAPGASRRPAALSTEAESRLIYGMRLARRLGVPIVVTGGRVLAAESVPAEADVARRLLLDLGFPDARILVESQSRTTAENARNTAEVFGFSRVAVVTSAYHMPRSLYAFEAAGISPVPAPAAFRTDRRPLRPIDAMPMAKALYNSSVFLREIVGLLFYRLVL